MLSPQARAGQQALTAIERAVLAVRRHGRKHRVTQKALDDAQEAISSFHADHGNLTVVVRSHGLLVADEVVLGSEEDPSELMQLLLPDGITRLELSVGFTRKELDRLVGVLAEHWRDRHQVELDGDGRLLTAIWSLGLLNLTYRVYDPLAPNATRVFQRRAALGTDVSSLTSTLAPVAARMSEMVEQVLGAQEGREDSEPVFQALQRRVGLSSDPASWSALPERCADYLASEPGRARQRLVERVTSRETSRERARAWGVVAWASRQPECGPDALAMGRFLAAMAVSCLAEEDVAGASGALSLLYDQGHVDEVRAVITRRLGTRAALELAARALRARSDHLDADELVEEGLEYLHHLDDQAVAPVCDLYASLANSDVRRVFRRFLSTRVADHAQLLEPLTRVHEEAIAREAIGILALGSKGSPARALLEQAARDDLEPRRTLALEALDVVTGERKRRELARVVGEGDDRAQRLEAIRQLKADGSVRAFEELSRVVASPDFNRRDEEEAHLAFDALTALGGLRSVRVLQEIAARKTGLLGRRRGETLKGIARAWLQRLKERGR